MPLNLTVDDVHDDVRQLIRDMSILGLTEPSPVATAALSAPSLVLALRTMRTGANMLYADIRTVVHPALMTLSGRTSGLNPYLDPYDVAHQGWAALLSLGALTSMRIPSPGRLYSSPSIAAQLSHGASIGEALSMTNRLSLPAHRTALIRRLDLARTFTRNANREVTR